MKRAPRRRVHASRHLCTCCADRQARFRYRGEVRADRAHNLCFRCFRAEENRQRARRFVAARSGWMEEQWLATAS